MIAVRERSDASTREEWDDKARVYRRWLYGELTVERPFTDAENAQLDAAGVESARTVNREVLLVRARTAIEGNAAYLDKVQAGTATQADHAAQIAALTRQNQGVIRLLVGSDLLDGT